MSIRLPRKHISSEVIEAGILHNWNLLCLELDFTQGQPTPLSRVITTGLLNAGLLLQKARRREPAKVGVA